MFKTFMGIWFVIQSTVFTHHIGGIFAEIFCMILNILFSYPKSTFVWTFFLNHLTRAKMVKSFWIFQLILTIIAVGTFKNNVLNLFFNNFVYVLGKLHWLLIVASQWAHVLTLTDTFCTIKLMAMRAFLRIFYN